MPAGAQAPATGLYVRPIDPTLRAALRALARAEGSRLYPYVIGILQAHVVRHWQARDKGPPQEALPGPDTRENS